MLFYFLLVTFAVYVAQGDKYCLYCTDAVEPTYCDTITTCGLHEECYIETRVTSVGSIRYNLGCRDARQCNASSAVGKRVVPDRRSSGLLVCSQCCSGNLCNSAGCGSTGYPKPRGNICFNCDEQKYTSDCNKITICGENEVCMLLKKLNPVTHVSIYQTKCETEKKCQDSLDEFERISSVIVGKRQQQQASNSVSSCNIQCCKSDMCNTGCNNTIHPSVEPSINPTTPGDSVMTSAKTTTRNGVTTATEATITGPGGDICSNGLLQILPTSSFTASSSKSEHMLLSAPYQALLNTVEHTFSDGSVAMGAWSPASDRAGEYIQVMFNRMAKITKIETQGRNHGYDHVTVFRVEYTEDGKTWRKVKNDLGVEPIFLGNRDGDSVMENILTCPITARGIRIFPLEWDRHIALRFDLGGCFLGNTARDMIRHAKATLTLLYLVAFVTGILAVFLPCWISTTLEDEVQTVKLTRKIHIGLFGKYERVEVNPKSFPDSDDGRNEIEGKIDIEYVKALLMTGLVLLSISMICTAFVLHYKQEPKIPLLGIGLFLFVSSFLVAVGLAKFSEQMPTDYQWKENDSRMICMGFWLAATSSLATFLTFVFTVDCAYST